MKKLKVLFSVLMMVCILCGCQDVITQVETVAGQIDVTTVLTDAIEAIDWEELEQDAKKGYDALTDRFPALKSENIKDYLKTNGLELLNSYVSGSDADTRENARKLGEILKILSPELADEVDSVISE